MKKIAIFLIFVVAGIAAEAQDTVRYGDPWYIFKPMPPLMPETSANTQVLPFKWQYYPITMQQYSINNTNEDIQCIYGVAFTGDGFLNICEDLSKYGYDHTLSAICVQDVDISLIMYEYYNGSNDSIGLMHINAGRMDSACIDHSLIKHTKFKYDYSAPVAFSEVVDCYEFYFDNPVPIISDTFYVGIETTHPQVNNHDGTPMFRSVYDANQNGDQYWIVATRAETITNLDSNSTIVNALINRDRHVNFSNNWGTFFPILHLRCTAPRGLRVEDLGAEGYVAQWAADTNAEDFEVAVCYTSQQPDNAQRYIQAGASLEAHIGTLSPDTTYRIHVRKRCSFTTSAYSDTVYGQWSAPVLVMATSGIEAASDRRLQFSVQPNPASGRTTVELDGETEGELTLMDVYGRPIRNVALTRGQRRVEVPLAGLSAGTYLLRLTTPTAIATRRLMVK